MRDSAIDVGTTNVKVALVAGDGDRCRRRPAPPAITERGRDRRAGRRGDVGRARRRRRASSRRPRPAEAARRRGLRRVQPVLLDRRRSTRAAHPLAPMLMWQDQRGTDHCFEIMARDETAFMTFVERHGIPTDRRRPVARRTSCYLQHDRPDVHERTAAYVEAMDYVTARADGPHHREPAQHVHVPAVRQPHARRDRVRRRPREARGRRPDAPPAARTRRRAPSGRLLPDVAAELGLPAGDAVYAGTNDTATVAVAAGAFATGRAGLSIGTTSVLVDEVDDFRVDLDHQLFSMPAPVSRPLRRLRGERARRQGPRARAAATSCTRPTSSATTASTTRSPRSTRCCAATAPGAGGVMFLPWLDGSLRARRRREHARRFREHVARDDAARHAARRRGGRRPQPRRGSCRTSRRSPGTGIDEIAFVGGAARSPAWCQILADVLDRPIDARCTPPTGRRRARDRAPGAAASRRADARADLDENRRGRPVRARPPHTAACSPTGKHSSRPPTLPSSRSVRHCQ